jgi:hypothetical protein
MPIPNFGRPRIPKRPIDDDDDLDDHVATHMAAKTNLGGAPRPTMTSQRRPAAAGNGGATLSNGRASMPGAGQPAGAVTGAKFGPGNNHAATGPATWTPNIDLMLDPSAGAAHDDDDDLDDLVDTHRRHEKERAAAAEELAHGKARALEAGARVAGLGGFGLSGASAALASDIGRQQDRTATGALADLDRQQRDEEFQAIQRRAALSDLEAADDTDYDLDGLVAGLAVGGTVGDGDPDNDEKKPTRGASGPAGGQLPTEDTQGVPFSEKYPADEGWVGPTFVSTNTSDSGKTVLEVYRFHNADTGEDQYEQVLPAEDE